MYSACSEKSDDEKELHQVQFASHSETLVILYENIPEIFCPKYSRHVLGKISTTSTDQFLF